MKITSDSIYWDCSGKSFNSLNICLQESVVLAPIIILIILFCNMKILLLYEGFLQNINP